MNLNQPITIFKKNLPSEQDTLAFGSQLAKAISQGAIIFLIGPLGAGKTTFSRGLMRGLGFQGKVKSPTYTLVEPYEIEDHHIFHFDLYRLKSAEELYDIGINDYFAPPFICLIEWPEKGFPVLPEPDCAVCLSFQGKEREVEVKVYSERGKRILERLLSA